MSLELSAVQKQLLTSAAVALKPGARLIYSACSLARRGDGGSAAGKPSRNDARNWNRSLLLNPFDQAAPAAESLWLWPQTFAGNGMFILRLARQALTV